MSNAAKRTSRLNKLFSTFDYSLSDQEKRDTTWLLYKNSGASIAITAVACSAFVLIFSKNLPAAIKWSWYALMLMVLLARVFNTWMWYKKINSDEFNASLYLKLFSYGVIVTGIVWAIYPFVAFKYLSSMELSCTMIVIAGMAGGGSTILSAYKKLAIIYITTLLLPFTFCCILWSTNPSIVAIGVLAGIYWLIMVNATDKNSKFIVQAIRFNNQNINLLEDMATEKTNLQVMHKKLNQAYEELHHNKETLEQKVIERTLELEEMATHDNLTGLLNRSCFLALLDEQMQKSQQTKNNLALFFIDLDGFKEINDLKGHLIGDELLKTLAMRLTKKLEIANINCRWGGDEFIVCSQVEDDENAIQFAKLIRSLMIAPVKINYDQVKVGATVGIAIYPQDSQLAAELIHAADVAMYTQKRIAKGGVCRFLPAMLADIHYTQRLKEGLSHAIEKQQLSLLYQPIIDTSKNQIICFEALLRWHFNDELVMPGTFISIAEDSGAINEIGFWVLCQACVDAAQWLKNIPAKVSVNVSVRQLLRANFIANIDYALKHSGLPASQLKIEITESVFAENMTQIVDLLYELKFRGIAIAIDDFGTGFSSLSYLQAIPMNEIKIDKIFVQTIHTSGKAIIKATLSIAEAFNCDVVAEGIESAEVANQLKTLGVNSLQGFFYAKPMPLEKLLANYLQKNTC